MLTTYNTAETVRYLGRNVAGKKLWVTKDVLDLCDERRDLNKKRYEAEGAKEHREVDKRIQKSVKRAKVGLDRCSVRGYLNFPEQKLSLPPPPKKKKKKKKKSEIFQVHASH